ncbi:MAG: hypothetical protein QOE82_2718 [Thermoanaerobaculia bacterium]|nr:hypothetical protein [Thermoanaerobaculia bacterium]
MFDKQNFDRQLRVDRRANRQKRGDNPWARLVWGCAILAAGIIGWLDHTGQLNASDYLQWWPLVLIAMGLAHLPQRQWISTVVMVGIGVLFLPELPFLPHVRLAAILGVWPLLISAGGVSLIRQALQPTAKDASRDNSFHSVAVMGGVGRGVASSGFVGGDVVAIMGGCEINLAGAKVTSEAVIDVLAFWGGIEIHVPRGWRIENHVLAILGGVVDKTDGNAPAGAPTLIIRGSAIMGGVEIRHPKG